MMRLREHWSLLAASVQFKSRTDQGLLPNPESICRLQHLSHLDCCAHACQDDCFSDQARCELCIVECRSQHIFINPEMPRSAHGMSYNCIGFDGNQRSFNDGYHTIHHLNSKLHWSQLPQHFIRCTQQQSLSGNIFPPT